MVGSPYLWQLPFFFADPSESCTATLQGHIPRILTDPQFDLYTLNPVAAARIKTNKLAWLNEAHAMRAQVLGFRLHGLVPG